MARPYHDPNLRRRTLAMLAKMGLATPAEEEDELEPEQYEPAPLRDPPVEIATVHRRATPRTLRLSLRAPQRLDLSLVGAGALALGVLLVVCFWLASTFPISVKLAGLAGTSFVVGAALCGLAYWIVRR